MGHQPGRNARQGCQGTDLEDQIKSYTVAPPKDNPQYIVQSDKSGKKAAHKPDELKTS